ncbi:uncharacterized 47.3 kDa protein in thcA 5'region [Arthrobacter sp. Hiyo4]|nr:uncharacterized 47.3 kDa protein in thcA 5'region [Arthrobacter sp. Hiyo4]
MPALNDLADRQFKFRPAPAGAHRRPRRDPVAGGQPGGAAAGGPARVLRGADWSEAGIGTNAISEALVTGRPVQLFSAEHLVRTHHEWACTAAPITDPLTGKLLGVLDVSGPLDTISADTLRMVRCAVRVAESLLGTPDGGTSLGASPGRGASPQSVRRPVSTVERLEMFRVRSMLGDAVESNPYRFVTGLTGRSNSGRVLRLLSEGRVAEALETYTAPLLSRSGAWPFSSSGPAGPRPGLGRAVQRRRRASHQVAVPRYGNCGCGSCGSAWAAGGAWGC